MCVCLCLLDFRAGGDVRRLLCFRKASGRRQGVSGVSEDSRKQDGKGGESGEQLICAVGRGDAFKSTSRKLCDILHLLSAARPLMFLVPG